MSLTEPRSQLPDTSGLLSRVDRAPVLFGLACLVVTCLGWGLNWPITKLLLQQCPPLSARGVAGLVSSFGLAAVAALRGESLYVPAALWPALCRSALLNVSAWMGLTTLSLLWLNAGEAATLAYTMPVWAALMAWPFLGERPSPLRVLSLALAVGSVATLLSGGALETEAGKLPGVVSALTAALLFGLGAVLTKRSPLPLTPLASTAWQIGLGCLPLLAIGAVTERPDFSSFPALSWAALVYTAAISMGVCYVAWFAALRRLSAGVATLGTMLTPIIGVVAATLALGEPMRATQVLALGLVTAAILLSVRG